MIQWRIGLCKAYIQHGHCRNGSNCKYEHPRINRRLLENRGNNMYHRGRNDNYGRPIRRHVDVGIPLCQAFRRTRYCDEFETCRYFHNTIDCERLARTGACPFGTRCTQKHRRPLMSEAFAKSGNNSTSRHKSQRESRTVKMRGDFSLRISKSVSPESAMKGTSLDPRDRWIRPDKRKSPPRRHFDDDRSPPPRSNNERERHKKRKKGKSKHGHERSTSSSPRRKGNVGDDRSDSVLSDEKPFESKRRSSSQEHKKSRRDNQHKSKYVDVRDVRDVRPSKYDSSEKRDGADGSRSSKSRKYRGSDVKVKREPQVESASRSPERTSVPEKRFDEEHDDEHDGHDNQSRPRNSLSDRNAQSQKSTSTDVHRDESPTIKLEPRDGDDSEDEPTRDASEEDYMYSAPSDTHFPQDRKGGGVVKVEDDGREETNELYDDIDTSKHLDEMDQSSESNEFMDDQQTQSSHLSGFFVSRRLAGDKLFDLAQDFGASAAGSSDDFNVSSLITKQKTEFQSILSQLDCLQKFNCAPLSP